MIKPLITTTNLAASYGELEVLRNTNLQIQTGEFVVIVGKSGSGKSTLLHALAGLIPYEGEIEIPTSVGVVFQQQSLFPWLTVEQNISVGLQNVGVNQREGIIAEHINLAGLKGKRRAYPAQLSGGQVQRVALARSLAHDPTVLLMDEPYGSLDTHTRSQMQQWLLRVWEKRKKTVVFVTHDIEEAIFLGDRVLVLENGHITDEFMVPLNRNRQADMRFSAEFNNLRGNITHAIYSQH